MDATMKVRAHIAFDLHHRSWNDCLLALGTAGLKHLVFDFMLVMNIVHGPWKSSEWFRLLQQSFDKWLEKCDCHDELFQLLYSGLSRDVGEDRLVSPLCVCV